MMVTGRGWRQRGTESFYLMDPRVSVWEDEKVLEMDGNDDCTTM